MGSPQPKRRSGCWNGCFLVLAFAWGLLLIVGFATTHDGPAWSRYGPPGWDIGPALVFFAGLGILYGIKRGAEAIWDWLGEEPDHQAQDKPPGD